MSEWVRAKNEVKEFRYMEKLVTGYSYKNEKESKLTDKGIRDLIADELNRSKNILFNLMRLAYKEEEDEIASNIEEVRDEIELFLNEIKTPLMWNDKLSKQSFERIIKSDLTLIKNTQQLTEILNGLYDQVLQSKAKDLIRKSEELRKYVIELRQVFKERKLSVD